MNICLVNNIFPPIYTGSSLYTYDLATKLTANGHKVIVITSLVNREKEFEVLGNGFEVYRLRKYTLPRLKLWLKFPDFYFTLTLKNIRFFKALLIKKNIDIIHQCNNIFDLVFASAYLSKKLKIPLICSLTTQIQHYNKRYNFILEIFDKLIIKNFFSKYVSAYIALDNEIKRYIKDRYNLENNVHIIPYSISKFEQFNNIIRDYSKTNFKIVSLGHISENRNRIELILAWEKVIKKIHDAELIIIGNLFDKSIKNIIKEKGLENNITFTGLVKHEMIPEKIKNVDLGCIYLSNLPYSKGIGSANLELMASGLPVILNADDNFFGDKFPLKSGEHFVRLESRNPDWLANKIIEIFENQELRTEIGLNGQKFMRDVLTWDRIIDVLEKVYKNQIKEKAN